MICDKISTCIQNIDNRMCNNCMVQVGVFPIIKCDENHIQYVLYNKNALLILKCHFDGGAVKGGEIKRCDYIVSVPTQKRIYFIELKGKSINHACEQILASIDHLSVIKNLYKVYTRIVCSSVPKISSPKELILKKQYNLEIKSKYLEENLL